MENVTERPEWLAELCGSRCDYFGRRRGETGFAFQESARADQSGGVHVIFGTPKRYSVPGEAKYGVSGTDHNARNLNQASP
jgi:hypothetical protein